MPSLDRVLADQSDENFFLQLPVLLALLLLALLILLALTQLDLVLSPQLELLLVRCLGLLPAPLMPC